MIILSKLSIGNLKQYKTTETNHVHAQTFKPQNIPEITTIAPCIKSVKK